ncbi:MAG TPA: HAMP domain-containing sensor histidine kinase [Desulfuromonadaceae bacterium]|nr:HAMP domain-containing sensor histidine kinase [Desulfuromonadaceae bacterium]
MSEKALEKLVRENARLRGDLLTIGNRVSHDLRTPLGSILNTAELVREILMDNRMPTEPLDALFVSVDEMMRLIKTITLMAKASSHPPAVARVRMVDAVYGAWQRLERQILKRGANVGMEASWPEVDGVPEWLEFIWWNLLANALQHGGRKIELGWREEKGRYRFFIHDNGNGVPAERRAKLFQPFDELHRPDSPAGFGLPMIQRLVELQGGTCGYEEGRGAKFYFTLPLKVSEKPVTTEKLEPREVAA